MAHIYNSLLKRVVYDGLHSLAPTMSSVEIISMILVSLCGTYIRASKSNDLRTSVARDKTESLICLCLQVTCLSIL